MVQQQTGVHEHGPETGLVPVEDARERVLGRIQPLSPIELPLQEAHGCVAAAEVVSTLGLPEFSSSAMDGFACRSGDVAGASEGRPVRPAGEDVRPGDVLVPAGRRLSAGELGLLASAGHPQVLAHPRPRVVVFSTGDELVEPGQKAAFGQVRDANSFTIAGSLREAGAVPYLGGIVRDDVEAFREALLSHLVQADAFISSGGVSVGERHVVKRAFFRRGDVDFFRVAMQPGMPQAFGLLEGKPYFGLPGNPVSAFVSFEVFVRPAVLKMMGRRNLYRPEVTATLEADVSGPREKVQFARARVRRGPSGYTAAV